MQDLGAQAVGIALMPAMGERKLDVPEWARNLRAGVRADKSVAYATKSAQDLEDGLLNDLHAPPPERED